MDPTVKQLQLSLMEVRGLQATFYEIIIEDEGEDNTDMSESSALANSLITSGRVDDTLNSVLESFQVLSLVLFLFWLHFLLKSVIWK